MPRYLWFVMAVVALILGYAVYGRIVERVFGAEPGRRTPAVARADGVDYVGMPAWKVWLIQLLNIAGVGPVFGPIMGALYGPAALLWIVLGAIFAGAVHDYMSGMISLRHDGANVPDIVDAYLGSAARRTLCVFAVVMMILVGAVFATAPAGLLAKLTAGSYPFMNVGFWLVVIFAYYFVATMVPIDKLIGRIYPAFGALLLIMAVGMTVSLLATMPDRFFAWAEFGVNQHPKGLPLWPLMFITIACGALSGFHSTQSPLMARCLRNESEGRPVFYGAMIAEGFIGLVWTTVGMTFYDDAQALMAAGASPADVVYQTSRELLGSVGSVLAILGVIVLPVTSGDTALRAGRLIIADALRMDQRPVAKRLLIAVPLFAVCIMLSQIDFGIVWRYFGWCNQVLAGLMLWTFACYLRRHGRCHWICTLPAAFISAAVLTYIVYEPNMGFGVGIDVAMPIGAALTAALLAWFLKCGGRSDA